MRRSHKGIIMAIIKEIELVKIDVDARVGSMSIRDDIVVKEDGVEISRTAHRHIIAPFKSTRNLENGNWTHTPWDLDAEKTEVKAVATALWTDSIKTAWKTELEAESPPA